MNTTTQMRMMPDLSSRAVHVGLNVHKDTISIAAAVPPCDGDTLQLVDCGRVSNTPAAMKRKTRA